MTDIIYDNGFIARIQVPRIPRDVQADVFLQKYGANQADLSKFPIIDDWRVVKTKECEDLDFYTGTDKKCPGTIVVIEKQNLLLTDTGTIDTSIDPLDQSLTCFKVSHFAYCCDSVIVRNTIPNIFTAIRTFDTIVSNVITRQLAFKQCSHIRVFNAKIAEFGLCNCSNVVLDNVEVGYFRLFNLIDNIDVKNLKVTKSFHTKIHEDIVGMLEQNTFGEIEAFLAGIEHTIVTDFRITNLYMMMKSIKASTCIFSGTKMTAPAGEPIVIGMQDFPNATILAVYANNDANIYFSLDKIRTLERNHPSYKTNINGRENFTDDDATLLRTKVTARNIPGITAARIAELGGSDVEFVVFEYRANVVMGDGEIVRNDRGDVHSPYQEHAITTLQKSLISNNYSKSLSVSTDFGLDNSDLIPVIYPELHALMLKCGVRVEANLSVGHGDTIGDYISKFYAVDWLNDHEKDIFRNAWAASREAIFTGRYGLSKRQARLIWIDVMGSIRANGFGDFLDMDILDFNASDSDRKAIIDKFQTTDPLLVPLYREMRDAFLVPLNHEGAIGRRLSVMMHRWNIGTTGANNRHEKFINFIIYFWVSLNVKWYRPEATDTSGLFVFMTFVNILNNVTKRHTGMMRAREVDTILENHERNNLCHTLPEYLLSNLFNCMENTYIGGGVGGIVCTHGYYVRLYGSVEHFIPKICTEDHHIGSLLDYGIVGSEDPASRLSISFRQFIENVRANNPSLTFATESEAKTYFLNCGFSSADIKNSRASIVSVFFNGIGNNTETAIEGFKNVLTLDNNDIGMIGLMTDELIVYAQNTPDFPKFSAEESVISRFRVSMMNTFYNGKYKECYAHFAKCLFMEASGYLELPGNEFANVHSEYAKQRRSACNLFNDTKLREYLKGVYDVCVEEKIIYMNQWYVAIDMKTEPTVVFDEKKKPVHIDRFVSGTITIWNDCPKLKSLGEGKEFVKSSRILHRYGSKVNREDMVKTYNDFAEFKRALTNTSCRYISLITLPPI